MADSLFGSLLNTLDKRTVSEIAGALGQPEQSVSRCMETSIAGLLGGLANKSDDPNVLRKVLDIAPTTGADVSWPQVAGSVTNPSSPLMTMGKKILSTLFGGAEGNIVNTLGRESGLAPGATSTLMTMAAPVVINFLNRRMRDNGMNIAGLSSLLQRESSTIRSALPAGLTDVFWPQTTAASSPVVAQTVTREHTSSWLPALAIAALALGLFWLLTHGRRPSTVQNYSPPTGTASRMATPPNLGNYVQRTLPDNVSLNIPERGVEARLLGFIQDPAATPNTTTWFNFDRLVFDTNSATLRPESQDQLNNIAAIMVAYPNCTLKIGGYTDNQGGAERNLKLSGDRANAVMAALAAKGISPSRLSAEGYGEAYPVADNSTEEGRAQNRRVAMRVTHK